MDLVADVHARVDDLGGAETQEERDLFATLLTSFADRCAQALDRLDVAVGAGDVHEVQLAAHAFKGSASNVGVQAVAAICADLERRARAGEAPATADLTPLRAELDVAVPALRAIAADFAAGAVPEPPTG